MVRLFAFVNDKWEFNIKVKTVGLSHDLWFVRLNCAAELTYRKDYYYNP